MEHPRPLLITTEAAQPLPLLIIDKQGNLGIQLVEKLKDQFLIVFVSALPREKINDETLTRIVHIHYGKKIPMIPDNIYSHIFTFYDNENETLNILPSLVRQAERTKAKLLFITSLWNNSAHLQKHLQYTYSKFEILIYGEVFGDNSFPTSPLTSQIRQLKTTGKIILSNMGLTKTYPIFIEDLLAGIIAVGFAIDKKRKLVYLFPGHPITEISVARMLQKRDPLLKIDFKKDKTKEIEFFIPAGGEYIFHDYDLERRLLKLDLGHETTQSETPKTIRKTRVSNLPNKKVMYIYAVAILVLIPILLTLITAGVGVQLVVTSLKTAETGNLPRAKQEAQLATFALDTANMVSNSLSLLNMIAPQPIDQLQIQINTAQEIAHTEVDTISSVNVIKEVIAGRSLNPQNDFLHAIATIKNSLITMQKIKAENGLPKQVLEKLKSIDYPLSLAENTMDALPLLLGFNTTKNYLILFQNNMELRPSGGFIGSYGILTIHNGQVSNFKVYDVYDADGKLTQPIEPPFALNRYLGASHWFLRDSNFDLDFTKDAQTASNFLELETGQKVDGVMAIDTDVLKKLLEAFGSVTVPDYKQTVTPQNFYLITQNHTEKNFFPGSTQKKDFLSSLYNAIFLELAENKNVSKLALINKIGEAIKEKHILFSFPDKSIQELFSANNLSDALWDGRTKQDNGIVDVLGINEANLGTNKVNYYIKRNIDQKININDQGEVQSTATITYQNTSNKTTPYGGDYKNYLRFILPNGTQLQTISINNQPVEIVPAVTDKNIYTQNGFIPPTGMEVEQLQEEGTAIYGFLVNIPMGQTKTVAITYLIPQTVNGNRSILNYSLKLIKQPGTENDPYRLTLSYPSGFKLFQSTTPMTDVGGKVVYNGSLTEDQIINSIFTK